MIEKELLSAFLSKTLNMDEAAVASLYAEDGKLKDDALTTLESLDVERVKKLKPDSTDAFNNGHKKGKSEALSQLETEFLKKTSFKSDKKGIDLFLDYATQAVKEADKGVNDDAIKKHPLFISEVERLQSEKEAAIVAESAKLTKFQGEIKAKEAFSAVSNKAMELFNSYKPVLSKDPVKAKNQMEDFVGKLKGFEYDIQADKIIVLKDGKVVEDSHGNRVPFEKLVKQEAERYYDFHVADPRQAPANKNGQAPPKTFDFEVPKNPEQYAKMIGDSSRPVDERMAIKEAYEKSQTV